MKSQILFSGKNKKNISKCYVLKILPDDKHYQADLFKDLYLPVDFLAVWFWSVFC